MKTKIICANFVKDVNESRFYYTAIIYLVNV